MKKRRFTKADITPRCDCNTYRIVSAELGEQRHKLPAGQYGETWRTRGYYVAYWYEFRCGTCGAVSVDFHLMKWGPRYSYPINPPFTYREGVYKALYEAVKEQLP